MNAEKAARPSSSVAQPEMPGGVVLVFLAHSTKHFQQWHQVTIVSRARDFEDDIVIAEEIVTFKCIIVYICVCVYIYKHIYKYIFKISILIFLVFKEQRYLKGLFFFFAMRE